MGLKFAFVKKEINPKYTAKILRHIKHVIFSDVTTHSSREGKREKNIYWK